MSKTLPRGPRRPKRPRAPVQTEDVPPEMPNEQIPEETPAFIEHDRRHALIEQQAYYRAEERGFEPGHELDDWLTAERDVDQALTSDHEGPGLCGD